jgi:hypothetical protein
MGDLLFVLLAAVLLAASFGFVLICQRLGRQ